MPLQLASHEHSGLGSQVRFARQTGRLDEIVTFYRDGLALPQIDHFAGHAGYDGVTLGLPATGAHLEFTTTERSSPPMPHVEDLLCCMWVISEPSTRFSRGSLLRQYPARTPTGTKSAQPSVILMAFGSFWWAKHGRDQALPTATQPRPLPARRA